MDRLVERIFALQPNGEIKTIGNYSDYRNALEKRKNIFEHLLLQLRANLLKQTMRN
ncbi:MAG: hypothetical protein U0T81_09125 [Saprospiraceae bacterium]